jgi:uncharacterized protein YrrD
MEDLGAPIAYTALEPGTPVYSSDGRELGKVEHVLADAGEDVFDGIVIDRSVLPGGHRFVDASQVGEIHERGLVVAVDGAAAESLPEPSANPAVMEANVDTVGAGESETGFKLEQKLRRAWDVISGNT